MASNTPVKPGIDGYITVSRQWCLKAARLKSTEKSIAFGVLSLPFIRSEHGWRGSFRQFSVQTGISRNEKLIPTLIEIETKGFIRMSRGRGYNGLTIKILDPWLAHQNGTAGSSVIGTIEGANDGATGSADGTIGSSNNGTIKGADNEAIGAPITTAQLGCQERHYRGATNGTIGVPKMAPQGFTTEVVERDERDERVKIGDSQDPIAEFKDERDESQDPTAESENVVYESPEEPPALQRKLEAHRKKFFESTQREAGQDPIAEFESVVDVSPVQLPPPLKKKPISPPPKRDPRKYRDKTKVTHEQVTAFQDWLNEADFTVSGARSRAQRVYKARSLYELTYGALLEIYDYYRDRGAARDKALAEKGLFNA